MEWMTSQGFLAGSEFGLDADPSLWFTIDENVKLQNDCINLIEVTNSDIFSLFLIFLTIQSRSAGTNGTSSAATTGRTKKFGSGIPGARRAFGQRRRLIADYGSFQIFQVKRPWLAW